MTSYYSKLWNMEFHESDLLHISWYGDQYEGTIYQISKRKSSGHYNIIFQFHKHGDAKFENTVSYTNWCLEDTGIIPTILNRKHNEIIEIEDEEYERMLI